MHARELVELAAIVSAHGPVLVRGVERLSEQGMEEYWTASKIRLDRWGHCLRDFSVKASNPQWHKAQWPHILSVLEENHHRRDSHPSVDGSSVRPRSAARFG